MRRFKYKDTLMCAWNDKRSYFACMRNDNGSCVVQFGDGDIPDYLEVFLLHTGTNISEVSEYKESELGSMISSVISNLSGDKTDNGS